MENRVGICFERVCRFVCCLKCQIFISAQEEIIEWLRNWNDQRLGIKPNNGALEAHGSPGEWDVQKITDMSSLFSKAGVNFDFNEDISGWDVSNVTLMKSMFSCCEVFAQDLTGWTTSNVTDFRYMFNECVAFKQDISGWDTTNAGKDSQEYILEVAKRDPSTMNKFAIE